MSRYRIDILPGNKDGSYSNRYTAADLQAMVHNATQNFLVVGRAFDAARQHLDEVIAIARQHHQDRLVEAALQDLADRRPGG